MNPKKNIVTPPVVAFLWHGDRNIGGGEYLTWRLAQRLSPDFTPLLIYSKRNHLVDQYIAAGIQTVHLSLPPLLTGTYRQSFRLVSWKSILIPWYFLKAVFSVTKLIRKHTIEILHPVDNISKIIGGIAGRLAGIKIVTHCHDDLGDSLMEKFLARFQLCIAHRVIAVSQKISHRLGSGKGHPKIQTIYNGIDLDAFPSETSSQNKKDRVTIGMVAMFDQVKGHATLVESLSILRSQNQKGWNCLLVGDGQERKKIEEKVHELNLSEEVSFVGYQVEVLPFLKEIDILVVPSLRESFGLAAAEAMAMQIPVVATFVGGLPEVVQDGETGILVPPLDSKSLASALKQLIQNPHLRQEMGKNGKERVKKLFTIKKTVLQTKTLYQQLLQGITP